MNKDYENTTNGANTGMDDVSTSSGIGEKFAIGGLIVFGAVTVGAVIYKGAKFLWGKISHRKNDEDNEQISGDEPNCEAEIVDEAE